MLAVAWIPDLFIVAWAGAPLLESFFACSRLRWLQDLRNLFLHLLLIRVFIDATHVILISDRRQLAQVRSIDLAPAASHASLIDAIRRTATLVAQGTSGCICGRSRDRLRVDHILVAGEAQVEHAIQKDLDLFD